MNCKTLTKHTALASAVAAALLLGFALQIFYTKFLKKRSWICQLSSSSGGALNEKIPPTSDFVNQFPPSRREALVNCADSSRIAKSKILQKPCPTEAVVRSNQIPSSITPCLEKGVKYTPTGFSTKDIADLGPFPDYSVLSGVPHPKPCPDFNIETAEFRPFRPFRFAYHQTMSLQKFEPDYWVELEKNYFSSLKQRKALLDQHKTSILNYDTGSEVACRELMEMVLQYLCIRYPNQFALEKCNTIFHNRLLDTTTDLTSENPLHVLFDNVPEDFAIMMRDEKDGMYYLKGGFICSSIGWTFGTHFKRQLSAIHTEVNDYAEKMSKSMDRYFSKMPADQPIQRGAWFVEDWKPLFVTPEEYAQNAGTRHQGESVSIEQCYLRVDWQTLRRLPLSGAIVFNFKAIFTPMTVLRDEPYVPALLHKQVTAGKPLLTEPKIHKHIRPMVLDTLQAWTKEQVSTNLIPADWVAETLPESPFYPGWEQRWCQRIGFEI